MPRPSATAIMGHRPPAPRHWRRMPVTARAAHGAQQQTMPNTLAQDPGQIASVRRRGSIAARQASAGSEPVCGPVRAQWSAALVQRPHPSPSRHSPPRARAQIAGSGLDAPPRPEAIPAAASDRGAPRAEGQGPGRCIIRARGRAPGSLGPGSGRCIRPWFPSRAEGPGDLASAIGPQCKWQVPGLGPVVDGKHQPKNKISPSPHRLALAGLARAS